MTYAGAHNPMYLVRNDELIDYKATKNPIGIYLKERPFEQQTIPYYKGDRIYLFSDGITDQIGGPKNRKFMLKQLKAILQETSLKSLHEQHLYLEMAFNDWTKDTKQLDDVILFAAEL